MQNVTNNSNVKSRKVTVMIWEVASNGVSIKERLGRMFMPSVAGIHYARFYRFREYIRRAGAIMPDNYYVYLEGLYVSARIYERLSFFHA